MNIHHPTSCDITWTLSGGKELPQSHNGALKAFKNTGGKATGVGGAFVVKRNVAAVTDSRKFIREYGISIGLSAEASRNLASGIIDGEEGKRNDAKLAIGATFGYTEKQTEEFMIKIERIISDENQATHFHLYHNYEFKGGEGFEATFLRQKELPLYIEMTMDHTGTQTLDAFIKLCSPFDPKVYCFVNKVNDRVFTSHMGSGNYV